ncbi:MAG: redoxin domain-containing protein [Ilumatobacter sp.]|uniref:redoxin domain-containing protein n=1 Tax=Ilumatobacter sp. TaxID=1967498 RepID=UPI002637ED02|nr:redoxin domain-containing protein [Ilumatobacter sp.]MDJ0768088.1 redoxin domain-containing protein [Ilumatobacter sp.]
MPAGPRTLAAIGLVALAAIVGAVVLSGGSTDEAAPPAPVAGEALPEPDLIVPAVAPPELPDRGLHPELLEIDGWLQSDVTSLEELRGDVVAVQFWTFGCRNCKNTLDAMSDMYAKYADQGFEIVGIHSPEFSYEAEVDNIVEAAGELGVTWPIVLDTTKRTFHFWQEGRRGHWPRIYLLDRDGHIRYDHIGEGRYAEIDAAVQALLAEPA